MPEPLNQAAVIQKHEADQEEETKIQTLEENMRMMREQLEIAKGNYEKKQLVELEQRER